MRYPFGILQRWRNVLGKRLSYFPYSTLVTADNYNNFTFRVYSGADAPVSIKVNYTLQDGTEASASGTVYIPNSTTSWPPFSTILKIGSRVIISLEPISKYPVALEVNGEFIYDNR